MTPYPSLPFMTLSPDGYSMKSIDGNTTLRFIRCNSSGVYFFEIEGPFGRIEFDAFMDIDSTPTWEVRYINYYPPNQELPTTIKPSDINWEVFAELVSHALQSYGVSFGRDAGKVNVRFITIENFKQVNRK